jgi:energy-coupling factor transporter ATP-binding protein EcfA2
MPELTDAELLQLTRAAKKNLRYDLPLDPDNTIDKDRLVDLNAARGDFSQDKLLWELGVDEINRNLDEENPHQYILFGGHRGCGKSTELRRLAKKLHHPDLYYVVLVDALKELDINNLHYSDILLAQAKVLIGQLANEPITVEAVFLDRLESWFSQRVKTHLTEQKLDGKLETGASSSAGLPLIGSLFAKLTTSISTGSTHKEEIRDSVRNHFSEFAGAFNLLIQHIEEQLKAAHKGNKILFVVDGTDRLSGSDATNFFIRDIHQLKQIQSNFIYCTPIDILTENGRVAQEFSIFRLPMVKLAEKQSTDCHRVALDQLIELINKRADSRLFSDASVLPELIKNSGGHVRDLMRLMDYCLAETLGRKKIDMDVVKAATKQLAAEYSYLIHQTDYALLAEIDSRDPSFTPVSDQSRRLLYDLALLEYNSHWWQSHPAVRTLPAYQQALTAYQASNP